MLLLTTDASVDARRFLPPGSAWAGYWDDPPRRFPERLSDEAARIVEKAIGELAPRPQVVIVLRDVQGWSAEQVCAALAIGDAEHRRLLHHARSAVRRALELFHDGA